MWQSVGSTSGKRQWQTVYSTATWQWRTACADESKLICLRPHRVHRLGVMRPARPVSALGQLSCNAMLLLSWTPPVMTHVNVQLWRHRHCFVAPCAVIRPPGYRHPQLPFHDPPASVPAATTICGQVNRKWNKTSIGMFRHRPRAPPCC